MKRAFYIVFLLAVLSLCLALSSCALLRRDDTSTDSSNNSSGGFTVTFDSNGGSVVPAQSVKRGSYAVEPSEPTRSGYIFLGWYYNDKEWSFSDTTVRGNLTLVAKWEVNYSTPAIHVVFDTRGGSIYDGVSFKDLLPGATIGDLPTPELDGYRFCGWYFEDDTDYVNRISKTTKIQAEYTDEITIVAKWEKVYYCIDGTEGHSWSIWKDSEPASCTSAELLYRQCGRCGRIEYKAGNSVRGHVWSSWSHGFLKDERLCTECGETEEIAYKNITQQALGPGNLPIIEGFYYESISPGILIDKNFENSYSSSITGRGQSLSITLNFQTPVFVDYIYAQGIGSSSYEVYYYTENDDYIYAGTGVLETFGIFECGEVITSVTFVATSFNYDSWQEVAIVSKESN